MPTYEYQCNACKHRFEKFQSITAAPIKKCPECGKSKVQRLISTGAGLIFKGSGFYITDYRSEGYKNSAKADSGTPADAAASKDAKPAAEGKPAAEPKVKVEPAKADKSARKPKE